MSHLHHSRLSASPVNAPLTPRRRTLPLPARGGEMALIEMGDPNRPVDLVFVHANGFNAMTFRSLLAPLASELRILLPDLRGHGRTRLPTPTQGRRDWHDLRDDLVGLLETLDGPPVILAGHSMGGTSSLLAALNRPQAISGLVLFDPVIWSRGAHLAFQLPGFRQLPARYPLTTGALKRRRHFSDRQQALESYRGRGAFRGWTDDRISDYLEDGLIEVNGEGMTLACAPEWEASNYSSQCHNPWPALDRLDRPIHILKAETRSPCRVRADPRRQRRVDVISGGTHFFPMIAPEVARSALRAACGID